MLSIVSANSLKVCFFPYLFAFFLGRSAARIFGHGLNSLNYGPSEGASYFEVMTYFYTSAFIGFIVMALVTVWLFVRFKKLKFSTQLFIALTAVFSITGIVGVAGMLSGLYAPQAVLAVIPLQFSMGFILVARYNDKSGVTVEQAKTSTAPNNWH